MRAINGAVFKPPLINVLRVSMFSQITNNDGNFNRFLFFLPKALYMTEIVINHFEFGQIHQVSSYSVANRGLELAGNTPKI